MNTRRYQKDHFDRRADPDSKHRSQLMSSGKCFQRPERCAVATLIDQKLRAQDKRRVSLPVRDRIGPFLLCNLALHRSLSACRVSTHTVVSHLLPVHSSTVGRGPLARLADGETAVHTPVNVAKKALGEAQSIQSHGAVFVRSF